MKYLKNTDNLATLPVLISGCSGGGKSTLLAEFVRRGFSVVEEPGRRIVRHERMCGGNALPWIDMASFARRAIEVAIADHAAARLRPGWIFFDRGIVDAAAALHRETGEVVSQRLIEDNRYHKQVFLTPPWPEIYVSDPERRHSFSDAVEEYHHIASILPTLGYDTITLPKATVRKRADFVLEHLSRNL